MNILIFNWRDPKNPLAGGAEQMVLEHAEYWQKKGAQVTWVASQFLGGRKEEVINGIAIRRFGSHYTVHVLVLLKALWGEFSSADILVDCFHFLPFFTPLLFKKKKIIAIIHEVAGKVWFDNIFYPLALLGFFIEPLFFDLYKNIQFITVSHSSEEELISVGIMKKYIAVIYNGVTLSKVKKQHRRSSVPTILFLNRISPDKGIMDALLAYKIVKKSLPAVEMIVAGKEQKNGLFEKLLKKSNVTEAVTYLGYVTEAQKQSLFQKSWILLHPSKKEGWGLTVLEANIFGTPVVGYNVPGLRDSVKNNKTGLLVKENPDALAKAIIDLLSHPEKIRMLSYNAKIWAKQFSWENAGEKSWNLMRKTHEAI